MAGPSVTVRILGDLKGLGDSLGNVGDKAAGVAQRGTAAFKTFLGSVNQTGALGPLGGMLDGIANGLSNLEGAGKKVGPAMAASGAAITGLGAGLSTFGSKEQAAHQQLGAAIDATGHSFDEYGDQIEGAIKHQENYGHTADETQNALQTLTQATHDPQKALDLLGEASDIAAAKHIDLNTAAGNLGKVYNGNTKLLKQFGIQIDANTGLTKDGKTATQALADVTKGQAAAATDTFAGKLGAVKAKLEDSVAQLGQKYGPALQGIGVAVTLLGTIWSTVGPIIAGMEMSTMWPILLIVGAVVALIAIGYVLYRNWDTIWSAIQTAISVVWNWIKDNWPLLLAILLGPIAIAVDLIIKYWDQIKDGIAAAMNFIQWLWGVVVGAIATAVGWVRDTIISVWDGIVSFFSGLPGRVAGFFTAIWDGVKNGVTGAINWIHQQWDNVVSWVEGLGGRIASAASGMWDGIKEAFRSAVNFIIRGWNSLHFHIPGFSVGPVHMGDFDLGLPQIPELAAGAIVTGPTLAMIGERGPEAVVPLGKMGPSVVIENATFAQELDVDLFMRRAAWLAQTSAT